MPPVVDAERLGRLHVFLALDRQRLAAHDARHVEPFDGADGDEHQDEVPAEEHDQHDDEEDEGQRIEDVDDAHHDEVDPAAEIAGRRAVDHADHDRDRRWRAGRWPARRGPAIEVRVRRSRPLASVPKRKCRRSIGASIDEPPAVVGALDDLRRAEQVGAIEDRRAAARRSGAAQRASGAGAVAFDAEHLRRVARMRARNALDRRLDLLGLRIGGDRLAGHAHIVRIDAIERDARSRTGRKCRRAR